jgi:hypothetical protein
LWKRFLKNYRLMKQFRDDYSWFIFF